MSNASSDDVMRIMDTNKIKALTLVYESESNAMLKEEETLEAFAEIYSIEMNKELSMSEYYQCENKMQFLRYVSTSELISEILCNTLNIAVSTSRDGHACQYNRFLQHPTLSITFKQVTAAPCLLKLNS